MTFSTMTLDNVIMIFAYAECHLCYAECRKLAHYAECHYGECHYAECRVAVL